MTSEDKAKRLGAALRDNLRRRKAQARDLADPPKADKAVPRPAD